MKVYFMAELRGIERREGKKNNEYLLFYLEDTLGKSYTIYSKALGLLNLKAEKGKIYSFTAEYDAKFSSLSIVSLEEYKNE